MTKHCKSRNTLLYLIVSTASRPLRLLQPRGPEFHQPRQSQPQVAPNRRKTTEAQGKFYAYINKTMKILTNTKNNELSF